MTYPKQIIGIIGGLGPYAHIDFESKLLDAARHLAGANADQDYPEWVLSSIPRTPDRTAAVVSDEADPLPWLLRSLHRLDAPGTGADFIAIPCNTAHRYLDDLRRESRIPVLDMIDETAAAIARLGNVSRAGLLATTGTLGTGLYHRALEPRGIAACSLLDLEDGEALQSSLVMEAIFGSPSRGGGIKGEGPRPEYARMLEEAATRLINRCGADVIVAGCTEIPLMLTGDRVGGVLLIDPTRILAEACIRKAYGLGRA